MDKKSEKLISVINFWLKLCKSYNDRYMNHPTSKIRIANILILLNEELNLFDNIEEHYDTIKNFNVLSLKLNHDVFKYFHKIEKKTWIGTLYEIEPKTSILKLNISEKMAIYNTFKKTEIISYIDILNLATKSYNKQTRKEI